MHSKENRHVLGNCDGEVNGSVWCADKVHLSTTTSIFIKNIQQSDDGASKVRIVLQACSWWEIEATRSHNLRDLSSNRNAKLKMAASRVNENAPPAPQAASSNQSLPSDDLIAQFLTLTDQIQRM